MCARQLCHGLVAWTWRQLRPLAGSRIRIVDSGHRRFTWRRAKRVILLNILLAAGTADPHRQAAHTGKPPTQASRPHRQAAHKGEPP